jgi:lysophospholipase L1-like esterase
LPARRAIRRWSIPASMIASARAQFDPPGTPRPAVTPEDLAAYQKMQAEQREKDWGNLCYFRADNAALAALPTPADRIVFMGDSITQLWGFAKPQDFGPARVNRGISGQTTPQMLLRFKQDVLSLKPAAVHILAGINDVAGNTGPTTLKDIQNNITSMVELAKAHGVTVILATPLPADRFNWAPQMKPAPTVIAYANWIRRYAAEQDLVLADYYPVLATPRRRTQTRSRPRRRPPEQGRLRTDEADPGYGHRRGVEPLDPPDSAE